VRILAVETSGLLGGIALAEGPNLVAEVRLSERLHHARDLLVTMREACAEADWSPRGIDLVAVSIGPGSFTGLRIAVTLAKVMAWDAGTRVAAVPTLPALAENAPADRPRVCTVLDAKRYGLYTSVFERRADGTLAEVLGPTCLAPEELAGRLAADTFVLGRGIAVAQDALGRFDLAPEALWDVRPAAIARTGLAMAERGELADPMHLEPVYLRRPEAEELWERRQKQHS